MNAEYLIKTSSGNYLAICLAVIVMLISPAEAGAKISGSCSNCHTMHNSQNGATITGTPNKMLLRSDCVGCHASGISGNINPFTNAPQVSHSGSTDLAGGNFAYISDSDANGHNLIEFSNPDDTLNGPPGAFLEPGHETAVTGSNMTCAGDNGCHGKRVEGSGISGVNALKGAHHKNVEGRINVADNHYNSYRFLWGVKGYEDKDWQNSLSAVDHNEYFGTASPPSYSSGNCANNCHGADSITAPQNTISGFCATCHGNFHSLDNVVYGPGAGIGMSNSSPFQRHPNDTVLPGGSSEYAVYTSYNVDVPVARGAVPFGSSPTVIPNDSGATGSIIMCMSCHRAHASPYAKMLRWDYRNSILSVALMGCNVCHTSKN